MKKLLIAVAVTAAMQVSAATAATLNFNFSFTSTNNTSPNVAGTVTGEIFGLQDNQSSTPATDVKILSYPSGLGLSLATPFDIFTDPSTTIHDNTFQTSGGHIISFDFFATSSAYNFFLVSPTGLLGNPIGPLQTTGTPSFTPLPAALPLFATGIGGLALLGWRRKRKARALA